MSKEKAQKAKDQGNAAFKAADYPTAIGHYTNAIIAERNEPTYYLNRAAAYLKLGKNEDAERDCTSVLDLSDNNVKALFRRGQARIALGKFLDARRDLSDALLLEPSNAATQEEMKKLTSIIQQEQAKKAKVKGPQVQASTPTITPIKRRRVPIRIVGAPGSIAPAPTKQLRHADPETALSSSTLPQPQTKPPETLEAISSRSLTGLNNQGSLESGSFASAKSDRESAKPSRVNGGIFRPFEETTASSTEMERPPNLVKRASGLSQTTLPHPPPRSLERDVSRLTTPATLFEFQKTWESISSPHERWLFFSNIPPESLPALCKTSLEPSLLASILDAFLAVLKANAGDQEMKRRMLHYLECFGKVPRLGTVVLFFSKKEREIAKEVWKELGSGIGGTWSVLA